MKIVADNTVPYLKGIAEPIAEVKYLTSKEFTPENVKDADILIVRSIDKCTCSLDIAVVFAVTLVLTSSILPSVYFLP